LWLTQLSVYQKLKPYIGNLLIGVTWDCLLKKGNIRSQRTYQ